MFFALDPPPDVRQQIIEQRAQLAWAGRAVATSNLHVTLVFIGNVARARLAELCGMAASLAFPQARLVLDQGGRCVRVGDSGDPDPTPFGRGGERDRGVGGGRGVVEAQSPFLGVGPIAIIEAPPAGVHEEAAVGRPGAEIRLPNRLRELGECAARRHFDDADRR